MSELRLVRPPSADPGDVDGPFRKRREAGAAWCRREGLHEIFADVIESCPDHSRFTILEPISKAGWTYATNLCVCVRQAIVLESTAVMPTTVPMDRLQWDVACHDTPYRALDGKLPDTSDLHLAVHVAHGWLIRDDFARLLLRHDARLYVPRAKPPADDEDSKGPPLRFEVAGGVFGLLMPYAGGGRDAASNAIQGFTPAGGVA